MGGVVSVKLKNCKKALTKCWCGEKIIRTMAGFTAIPIRSQPFNGRLYHIQTSVDITDQFQLSMEATMDELTGVRNRNSGKRHLEGMLKMNGRRINFLLRYMILTV